MRFSCFFFFISIFGCSLSPSGDYSSGPTPQPSHSGPSVAAPKHSETATYYGKGDGFAGKQTASGETFDPNAHTAAHPSLPLGSEVEVRDKKTGKKTRVRINDRKPSGGIDLSASAARELGIQQRGRAQVEVRKVK